MKLIQFFIYVALLLSCSSSPDVAGGSSSETTSGIVVISSAGVLQGTAKGVEMVTICDEWYNPLFEMGYLAKVAVDSSGHFAHDSLPKGRYNIYAEQEESGKLVALLGVEIHDTLFNSEVKGTFEKGGTVYGYYENEYEGTDFGALFLIGSEFISQIDKNGQFEFNNIPAGIYKLGIETSIVSTDQENLISGFEAVPVIVVSDSINEWKK